MVHSIEDGFVQRHIADSAAAFQRDLETQKEFMVGMNIHIDPEAPLPFEPFELDPGLGERQIKRTQGIRRSRGQAETTSALKDIKQAATNGDNVMPAVARAVKAQATVGEMCDVLREVFGTYRGPIVY